jgi:hypothetical protein
MRRTEKGIRFLAIMFWAIGIMLSPNAFGQGGATGTITGIVTDASGAVVPGASVLLQNTATNVTWQTKSDSAGVYLFSNLPVGNYALKVTASGFAAVQVPALRLEVNATLRQDIKLPLGTVTQTVNVKAAPPMLNTSNASLGQVIASTEVAQLPLNGRDFQQLQLLTPGTVSGTNFQTSAALNAGASALTTNETLNISNGGRPGSDLFLVDGSDDSNENGRGVLWRPSIDEIQEFKVQTSNMSAQFGYGSTITNIVIKSGSNQLHGVTYDFVRNNVFDSRSFFAPSTEPLKWNQFGANAGGPVFLPKLYNGKNRTFWFFNYEGFRLRQGSAAFATVPTAQMRQGDFSQLPVQLYDPSTTRPNPSLPGTYIRDPFVNNQIPLSRENPATAFFLNPSWIPLPNRPGIANNLEQTFSVPTNYNQMTAKIDEYIGARDALNGRFSFTHEFDGSYGPYHGLNKVDPGSNPKYPYPYDSDLNWTHTFNPNDLMEARVSMSRANLLFNTPNLGLSQNYDTLLGLNVFPSSITGIYPSYPVMNISGFTGLPQGFLLNYISNNFEYTANFTMVRGRHTFQFGETFRDWQQNLTTSGQGSGTFSFTGTYTSNPSSPGNTGAGIADYFLGIPFEGSRYAPPGWYYQRMKDNWLYFNDDWKATPKLTLNLGIRYEINLPTAEKYGHFATFDPTARNGQGAIVVPDAQAVKIPSAISSVNLSWPFYQQFSVFANDVGINSKYLRKVGYLNFAPRVGLAYRLTNKTVLRAGYGLFYLPLDGNRESELEGPPFLVRESNILNDPVIPTKTVYNLFPPGSSFSEFATVFAQDPNATNFGYSQEWNLALQRQLPGQLVAQIAYVGSKGTDLQTVFPLNTPQPGPGDVQPRRPFPDFGYIQWNQQSFSSIYHSLQATVERRFSHGFSLLASYTWSKCIDYDSTDADGTYDPFNLAMNRGVCDFDVPQLFTMATVYHEPWFQNSNRFVRGVLGGWEIAPIISLQSGYPFTPFATTDTSNTGLGSRADVVAGCNPKLSNPTPQEWFNTACFVSPPGPPIYRFGNAGRNILRGDGIQNVDLGFYKNFKLGEGRSLQIRFEGFNVFNWPSFGLPNATVNTPGYGQITNASAGREIQMAAKLYF